MNLNSIFQRSLKILKSYYAEVSKKKQLKSFKESYAFNLPEIIGKARYYTQKKTLEKKARLPKSFPVEEKIKKLKGFISAEIDHIVSNFTLSQYTWLRSLVVSRFTLYNGRRGEEGSRFMLDEWDDAL